MDQDKILDYVMNSPQNTNRAVLSGMLDSVADTSSGVFWVNFSTSDGTSWSSDKTSTEIWDAFNDGKPIKMRAEIGGNYSIADLHTIYDTKASFQAIEITEDALSSTFSITSYTFIVSGSNATVTIIQKTFNN